jgi:hypothetical protein
MPKKHVVASGDCIASIAFAYGHVPDTVWNDPANETLRSERESGYVLEAGDVVSVPDLRAKAADVATDVRHVFRRVAVPDRLRVVLKDADGKPRAGIDYVVEIDTMAPQAGTTGDDGLVEAWIAPAAPSGVLRIVGEGDIPLELGGLDPVTTDAGVRARLRNLGYLATVDASDADYLLALVQFQQQASLDARAEITDACRQALVQMHGS